MKKVIRPFLILILILTTGLSSAGAQTVTVNQKEASPDMKNLEQRIARLEAGLDHPDHENRWFQDIQVSGLIEVEGAYERIDVDDPALADEEGSDVDLATVELAVDARIATHVDGHVLFRYEDDDLFVDEGFIILTGSEAYPVYLIVGRQYIPFGSFDSHFITDPLTLELGETNEGTVVVGYHFGEEWLDISLGAFNGKTDKGGSDDAIVDMAASLVISPLDGWRIGAAYTSNLAAADSFADQVLTDLNDRIGGWSVFASVSVFKQFTVMAEYIAALDDFNAGELYDAEDPTSRRPAAWNVELGCSVIESLDIAARYGGSTDGDAGGAEFLPEAQYGGVVNWGLFDNTCLALEYLHSTFENDVQTGDTVTAQLAVEF